MGCDVIMREFKGDFICLPKQFIVYRHANTHVFRQTEKIKTNLTLALCLALCLDWNKKRWKENRYVKVTKNKSS